MIALPFCFFLLWTLRSYNKYGLSIGTYILSIYTISSLCAIFIDVFDLYVSHSCPRTELGFFAPFLYLFLLFICLFPFYKMGNLRFEESIGRRTEKILHYIIYFYFAVFLVVFFVSINRIEEILLAESLVEVRNTQYTGDKVAFYDNIHGPFRYVCALSSIISPSALVMLLVFSYLLAFSKKSKIYSVLALIGSFTPLLISINIVDRSQYVYWLIMAGFSILLFAKYYSKKKKRTIAIVFSVVLTIVIAYFTIVTIARFGDRDEGGAIGGLVEYIGMPYINFCRFINTLDIPTSFNFFFPTVNSYITGGDRYFDIAHKLEAMNHQPLCVFPTFLGIIYSVCGGFVLICFLLVYLPISYSMLNKYKRIRVNLSHLFKFWSVAVIPTIGIITYFYITEDISLFIWIFMSIMFSRIIKTRNI